MSYDCVRLSFECRRTNLPDFTLSVPIRVKWSIIRRDTLFDLMISNDTSTPTTVLLRRGKKRTADKLRYRINNNTRVWNLLTLLRIELSSRLYISLPLLAWCLCLLVRLQINCSSSVSTPSSLLKPICEGSFVVVRKEIQTRIFSISYCSIKSWDEGKSSSVMGCVVERSAERSSIHVVVDHRVKAINQAFLFVSINQTRTDSQWAAKYGLNSWFIATFASRVQEMIAILPCLWCL